MRTPLVTAAIAACAFTAAVCGQSTSDMPRGEMQMLFVDSGVRSGRDDGPSTVYKDLVHAADAAWMRLYFHESTELQLGSVIRLTSLLDNQVQELDAAELARWNRSSAYFNGDSVLVELVAGPNTRRNRVVVQQIALEIGVAMPVGSCGICGADNRVASDEDWSGRLLPAGCTASVWNEFSCLVSAGHCIGGNMVIQFRVPDSDPDCSLNMPPINDQFPVTQTIFDNGGVGADWATMLSSTNNAGQTIIERYGEFRPIASANPSTGQSLDIWGFGVDSQCTQSQRQQTSGGVVTGVSGAFFNHNVDATFGNSGSGVIRNGAILGIATHCPCNNIATRIDLPVFENARAELCSDEMACCFVDGSCQVLSTDDCAAANGDGLGVGTDCSMAGQCPEGFGACCYDGDVCVFGTQTECVDTGGSFQGYGVECDAQICFVPLGACCFDTNCVEFTQSDCADFGGDYLGDGVPCGASVCGAPTGACCFADGACTEVTDNDCAVAGGTFQGDGGGCTPNDCPQPEPTGACCFDDGSCSVLTDGECGNAGGIYTADDSGCAPNRCPQPNPCPADLDNDDDIDFQDLLSLLANWGTDGNGADIAEPNDVVDFQDLLAMLAGWGVCE